MDSSDHRSHFRYIGSAATCPSDFPVVRLGHAGSLTRQLIPALFQEVHYDTHLWNDYADQALNTSQPFVLSNGDTTGVRQSC